MNISKVLENSTNIIKDLNKIQKREDLLKHSILIAKTFKQTYLQNHADYVETRDIQYAYISNMYRKAYLSKLNKIQNLKQYLMIK